MLRDYVLALIIVIVLGVITAFSQDTFTNSDLAGIWRTGGMSMIGERNTVTGSTTPSNGNTQKYAFSANGSFTFTGYLQSTMYGCTTALFNDKRGRYAIDGDQLTLTPSKNFWRNTNSCSPSSTKERNYTLDPETFRVSTKTDEHDRLFICLANAKGETCYRREKE
ncbi:MAG: hypothetical protein ABL999_16735 [Pyrinomonadaceae bacterium]